MSQGDVRSLKALEIEIVELQRLEAAGDRGHIEALKKKKATMSDLLGLTAQGVLVCSCFTSTSVLTKGMVKHAVQTESGALFSESTEIHNSQPLLEALQLYRSEWTEAQVVEESFLNGLLQLLVPDGIGNGQRVAGSSPKHVSSYNSTRPFGQ